MKWVLSFWIAYSVALAQTAFPIKASSTGLYLVDQNGAPFLVHGCAGWGIISSASTNEACQYLTNRASKGFNSVIVRLIDTTFQGPDWANVATPPNNYYGVAPFSTPGDFTTPNETYFANADWVLNCAAALHMVVFVAPMYLGYGGAGSEEGWFDTIIANGTNKCHTYGEFLGNRYKDFTNLVWVMAGDAQPGAAALHIDQLCYGIKENDTSHLFTAHCGRTVSARDSFGSTTWLNLDTAYVEPPAVASACLTEYVRTPPMPTFLIEDYYEGEHDMSAQMLRAESWWSDLSGMSGKFFGNRPIWYMGTGWQAAMELVGTTNAIRLKQFFDTIQWWTLIPDSGNLTLTGGYGTADTWNYSVCGRNSSGSLCVCYTPTNQALTMNMSRMSGTTSGQWFDPTSGNYTTVSGSPFQNSGSRDFTPPTHNSFGDHDWVLLLSQIQTLHVSGTANVGTVTKQEAGGGGGPDRWYYSNPATNSANEQYWGGEWFLGNAVICTNAGTITKIAARMEVITGPHDVKLSLWWNNGGTWTQADCNTLSCGSYASNWFDLTLTSPRAVGNNETVRVFVTTATVSDMGLFYNGASGGFYDARSYANGCSGATLSTSDDIQADVAVYVD